MFGLVRREKARRTFGTPTGAFNARTEPVFMPLFYDGQYIRYLRKLKFGVNRGGLDMFGAIKEDAYSAHEPVHLLL